MFCRIGMLLVNPMSRFILTTFIKGAGTGLTCLETVLIISRHCTCKLKIEGRLFETISVNSGRWMRAPLRLMEHIANLDEHQDQVALLIP
jgi:hypothetical protein